MSHLVQSVTVPACTLILINVGRLQRGQPQTRSSFPSSLPKPHGLPVKKRKSRKLSRIRFCTGVADLSEEGRKLARGQREGRGRHAAAEKLACQRPLVSMSSCLERSQATAASVQCYTVTLDEFLTYQRVTRDGLELSVKLNEMVVELLE